MIDIVAILIIAFFIFGFGFGLLWSMAEKCAYCGNMIFLRKTKTRYAVEFGYMFIPYHRNCYKKYAKVMENHIVS